MNIILEWFGKHFISFLRIDIKNKNKKVMLLLVSNMFFLFLYANAVAKEIKFPLSHNELYIIS